jgi:hypothetical protein
MHWSALSLLRAAQEEALRTSPQDGLGDSIGKA